MMRKWRWHGTVAGVLVLAASAWADHMPPRSASEGIYVEPIRMAPIKLIDGQAVRTGEWIDITQGSDPEGVDVLCFDAFNADAGGAPAGGQGCGLPSPGSRWYFGESYCNTWSVVGFQVEGGCENQQADLVNVAWFWTVRGGGTREQCLLAIWTAETFGPCGGNLVFDGGFNGVMYDFGVLDSGVGQGYYYSNLRPGDAGLFHQLPADGVGAYIMQILTNGGNSFATCAQPMLWGTNAPGFCCKGALLGEEWDDDNPRDGGFYTSECYNMRDLVPCPNPLGSMMSFGVAATELCTDNETLSATCDENGAELILRNGVPGRSVLLCFLAGDQNSCSTQTINDNGTARVTDANIAPGQHLAKAVLACGDVLEQQYECPAGDPCTGRETLKAKCKNKNGTNKAKVLLKKGVPGRLVQLCALFFDPNSCEIKTINNKGKAKIKVSGIPTGPHNAKAVLECNEVLTTEYDCP